MDDEWPRLPLPPPPSFDHWDDAGELAVRWNEEAQQGSFPPPPIPEWELPPPDPNWGEPETRRPKWPYPRAPAFGDDLWDRAALLGLAPRDGWRSMGRIDRRVRRPGAHCSTDYDCYLKSLFPDHTLHTRCRLQSRFEVHEWAQNQLEKKLLDGAARIAAGFDYCGNGVRQWSILWSRDPALIDDLNYYECQRKDTMRMWWFLRVEERQRQLEMEIDGRSRIAPAGGWPPPERRRQFEKEAWRYDRGHKRVLAARRRLGRGILRRHLRRAVMTRAIALYWQEQTQRALCAPGGAGRAADAVAFASEFA